MLEAGQGVGSLALDSPTLGPDGDYVFAVAGRVINVQRTGGRWVLGDPQPFVDLFGTTPRVEGQGLRIEGRTRLAKPVTAAAVPGGAILHNTKGGTCVIPGQQPYRAVPVSIRGTSLNGNAQLEDGSELGSVVVNPGAALPEIKCP